MMNLPHAPEGRVASQSYSFFTLGQEQWQGQHIQEPILSIFLLQILKASFSSPSCQHSAAAEGKGLLCYSKKSQNSFMHFISLRPMTSYQIT